MKKKIFNTGATVFAGSLAIGPLLASYGMILLGLILLGLTLAVIGLFPDESEERTDYPAGSYLPGGVDYYNEIAEGGSLDGAPDYGAWGDKRIGFKWSGHDADGNDTQFVTWIEGSKTWRARLR